MKEKLFSNVLKTSIELDKLSRFLSDGTKLPIWNPAVVSATPENDGFRIHRPNSPFNPTELLTIQLEHQTITYQSSEGNIRYKLVLELSPTNHGTDIYETFYLLKSSSKQFSLSLMAPIMKKSFAQNLKLLADYLA